MTPHPSHPQGHCTVKSTSRGSCSQQEAWTAREGQTCGWDWGALALGPALPDSWASGQVRCSDVSCNLGLSPQKEETPKWAQGPTTCLAFLSSLPQVTRFCQIMCLYLLLWETEAEGGVLSRCTPCSPPCLARVEADPEGHRPQPQPRRAVAFALGLGRALPVSPVAGDLLASLASLGV